MSKVIILSGAGISAESGISTFRDSGGLWERHKIEDVCMDGCLERNKEMTIAFYDTRRADIKDKQPNHAHKTIAKLQKLYQKDIAIITQNVDDMFERAGCKDVLHLHGFLREIRCMKCGYIADIGYIPQDKAMLCCATCSSSMRPNIVFFHEMAPNYKHMYQAFEDCEMLVVIGTSGAVINTNMFLSSKIKISILNNLEANNQLDENLYTKVLFKPTTKAIDEISKDIEDFLKKV